MVALINPRGLHHFNERYRDHIGTTDLNGLHLLLVLWLRISRLRMYGWGYICFSSWHRYMRESQSAVSGCASLNGPVCAARSSLASSVGGAQITQIKNSLAGVQASSIRSAIGHIWPQHRTFVGLTLLL